MDAQPTFAPRSIDATISSLVEALLDIDGRLAALAGENDGSAAGFLAVEAAGCISGAVGLLRQAQLVSRLKLQQAAA